MCLNDFCDWHYTCLQYHSNPEEDSASDIAENEQTEEEDEELIQTEPSITTSEVTATCRKGEEDQ